MLRNIAVVGSLLISAYLPGCSGGSPSVNLPAFSDYDADSSGRMSRTEFRKLVDAEIYTTAEERRMIAGDSTLIRGFFGEADASFPGSPGFRDGYLSEAEFNSFVQTNRNLFKED